MTSYRVDIKRCPNCSWEFLEWVVASCNTFGATFYTDGFINGPMYDEGSALMTCRQCDRYYWREDVPIQESMRDSDCLRDPARRRLPQAKRAQGRDYRNALHKAFWKTEVQEKYIRTRAWWSFNNVYRGHTNEEFIMSPKQEANLLRLLQLLDMNNPNESIMKAEILRELGHFDECLKQLDQPFDDKYLPTIDAIKKLANDKKRRVDVIG